MSLLRKISYQVLTDKSGSDNAQVPVNAPTIKVYKRGATVSSNVTVSSSDTNKVVAVYDAGDLEVGDEVQLGTTSSAYAIVSEITSRTSIKVNGNTGTLALLGPSGSNPGSRLVCRTDRPTVYDEITGTHAMSGSPDVAASTTGRLSAFVAKGFVDLIISGGSPSVTAFGDYDYPTDRVSPSPWLDASMFESLQAAINACPSGGTVFIPAGTWTITAGLTITTSDVHLMGAGASLTYIQPSANNPTYHMLSISGAVGGTWIERISFNGRATGAANYDVCRIENTGSAAPFNTIIEKCSFYNTQRNGIRILGCFDTTVRDSAVFNTYGNAVFIDAVGTDNATHVYFDNFEVSACGIGGADVPAVKADHGLGIRFHNSRFESCRGGRGAVSANGIHLNNVFAGSIENCHFELDSANPPATLPTTWGQYICLENSRGIVMSGNSIDGGDTGSKMPQYAWFAYGTSGIIFQGGEVDGIGVNIAGCDSNCENIFIVEPHKGASMVATAYTTALLARAVRVDNGTLLLARYADDADFAARGKVQAGAMWYRTSNNKSVTYDGTTQQNHY